MSLRVTVAFFGLLFCAAAVSYGEERWYNFAEDMDLKYYIDRRSIVSRPGDTQIFWVKSVAKQRDYFKEEYNLNNLSYIMTNYEMDCSDASYRVRQIVMFDKNRRELHKSDPAGAETPFEPVPPESSIELAQESVCARADAGNTKAEGGDPGEDGGKRGATPQPLSPGTAAQPEESAKPLEGGEGEEPLQPEELVLPEEELTLPQEGPALR